MGNTEIDEAAAVETLNEWLNENGSQDVKTTVNDWACHKIDDAFMLYPIAGKRANRVYLVRGDDVIAYSPYTGKPSCVVYQEPL